MCRSPHACVNVIRELDVVREMAQGRGKAGIADTLGRAESSVEKDVNANSLSWA